MPKAQKILFVSQERRLWSDVLWGFYVRDISFGLIHMYPLIGNVLYAQKVFFAHISVLTQWNRNVDKIYYLYSSAKRPRIIKRPEM